MRNRGLLTLSIILALTLVLVLAVQAEGSSTRTIGNNSGNDEKYCEENSDCVQVVNKSNCCTYSCPSIVNKDTEEASDDWVDYAGGRDYFSLFNQSRENCTCGSSCVAVVMYPKCENNLCTLSATPPEDDEEENETDDDSDDDDENETGVEDECEWRCSKWSMCENGTASRTCQNTNNCTTEAPRLSKSCFERDKVCCKITETETENNRTKTKTEYKWEDRASCLETDEDEEGETKEIVGKNFCIADIRERCEYDGMKERIKCRLENHNRFENFSDSDESCEGLRNKGLCVALYTISQHCYKLEDGEKKDRCFKLVAEFRETQVGGELNSSENKTEAREKIRHYMVLVLYNLQGKVEKAVNKSKLTSEQGAALIEKIVEIKQSILQGESKETIRSQIQELKALWKTYKADEGENDE